MSLIGVGREAARRNAWSLLEAASRPRALLLLGFAGGADPRLRPGDLVLPSRYRLASPEGEEQPLGPDLWLHGLARNALARAGLPCGEGDSVTVERPAGTPESKAYLGRTWDAGIVDMEDYWVAQLALEAGVPFLAVRAVLDPAAQDLPGYVAGMAEGGATALLPSLCRPWRWPALLRLAGEARSARRSLSRFALAFVEEMESLEVPAAPSAALTLS